MLLDSNIIIYAAKPEYEALRGFIAKHTPAVSAISRVEVLGYHLLNQEDRLNFEEFFAAATILPISDSTVSKAIELRQMRKLSLGDALIGGTALVHELTLITRNVVDFGWIDGLSLLNPFEDLSDLQVDGT
jgi:predicted nucleic acid-binding protein